MLPLPPEAVDCEIDAFSHEHNGSIYILNGWDLQPGDVILFRGDSAFGTAIQLVQAAAGFEREAALWSHVAIYRSHGVLYDCTIDRGAEGRLFNVATKRREIAVRRIPGMAAAFAAHLSGSLARSTGTQYANLREARIIQGLLIRRIRKGTAPQLQNPFNAFREDAITPAVCSQYVDRLYRHVTGQHIHEFMPVPADFAASEAFEDVPLTWHLL